jgi:cyclopropane fatty-acyl-phospholipid synthase-like methyltransferase
MLNKHYNKRYFKWQSYIGEFGGKANLIKFNNLFKPGQKILDFGCGGLHAEKYQRKKY